MNNFHAFRYELLEIEEDENFIADIIDEITDGALEEITKNIIKSRVLPHTVLSVRDLLLDVIEVTKHLNVLAITDEAFKHIRRFGHRVGAWGHA